MTPDTRAAVARALAQYGGELAEGDRFVTPSGKVLHTRIEARKGRLYVVDMHGTAIASYPLSRAEAGVRDFVEKFWFWKPRTEGCVCVQRVVGADRAGRGTR